MDYGRITFAAMKSASTFYQANYQTEALRNILLAYAALDPKVGYNHKMLHLASVPLIFMPEEEAFRLLVQLMYSPKYKLRKLFLAKQKALKKFRKIFPQLVAQFLPKLYRTQNRHNVLNTILISTSWAYNLFTASNLPLALRIWDLFMLDGYDAIYVVGVCLLVVLEERIMPRDANKTFDLVQLEAPEFGTPDFIETLMRTICDMREHIILQLHALTEK
jgi:hypothetical protein